LRGIEKIGRPISPDVARNKQKYLKWWRITLVTGETVPAIIVDIES